MNRSTADRAIVAGASAVIVALTGAAFWLSYAHLADIAMAHGLSGERAWAWPATLDLGVIAGELLMLRAALQQRVDWWAIGLMVSSAGGSIVLNVAGVGDRGEPLDYVVAGVPPTAALVAFGVMMRQIHRWLAHPEPAPVPVAEPAPEPAEPAAVPAEPAIAAERAARERDEAEHRTRMPVFGQFEPLPEVTGTSHDQQVFSDQRQSGPAPEPADSNPVPAVPPAGSGGADLESEDIAGSGFHAHVTRAVALLTADPELTGTEIGTALGASDSYGRRVKRAALTRLHETTTRTTEPAGVGA
ncbi:DUF2637 domain-containing protein [Streptomyces sp. NPDC049879]|uniref:DUF2637 domain-containing protein n=1 Tax=Streptomyces sp. NPDC049879 TaxID=3365598 RepID=UPI0037BA87F3